eukprot:2466814-Pyramimonas_sp.AAC.1
MNPPPVSMNPAGTGGAAAGGAGGRGGDVAPAGELRNACPAGGRPPQRGRSAHGNGGGGGGGGGEEDGRAGMFPFRLSDWSASAVYSLSSCRIGPHQAKAARKTAEQ